MGTTEQFLGQLNKLRGSRTVIVGVGNTLKGDDGAGPLVCEQLKQIGVSAEVMDTGTVPENYIQPIIHKAPRNLLVIDAMHFAAQPGTIKVFTPEQLDSAAISTHTLSPRLFIDIVRQNTGAEVYLIGIQPAHTQLGQSLSAQVRDAVQRLSQALAQIFPPK
jgi:hydrogenase 3 maturation protease